MKTHTIDDIFSTSQNELWKACGMINFSTKRVKTPDNSLKYDALYKGKSPQYSKLSPSYLASTENLETAIEILARNYQIKGKRVLTLDGAGDSVIGFLSRGAQDTIKVEISSTGCMWAEFKHAAYTHLSTDEYISFIRELTFSKEDWISGEWPQFAKRLSPKLNEVYSKIKKELTKSTQNYWDSLLKGNNLKNIFWERIYDTSCLPYKDNTDKVDLNKSRIINSDIFEFLNKLQDGFDIIYCSNKMQYLYRDNEDSYNFEDLVKLQSGFLEKMKSKLSGNGLIASYIFGKYDQEISAFKKAAQLQGLNFRVYDRIHSNYTEGDIMIVFSRTNPQNQTTHSINP